MEAMSHESSEVIPKHTGITLYVVIASVIFILLHAPVIYLGFDSNGTVNYQTEI